MKMRSVSNIYPFQIPIQVYMTIAYTKYAASAIAASSVLRSIAGALVPLAGIPLYDRLGLGLGKLSSSIYLTRSWGVRLIVLQVWRRLAEEVPNHARLSAALGPGLS